MTHDPATLAASFLHWLHEREVQHDHPDAVRQFGHAYEALTQFARQANSASQNSLLHTLSAAFSMRQSNWEFGSLANTCGAIVEWGGDPGIAIEPILDRITEQFGRVPAFVLEMGEHLGVEHPNQVADADWRKLGEEHPDQAWVIGEWYALRFNGCAAMAMLTRDVEARQRARTRIDLIQRAESARSDNPYAYYLAELLGGMVDDECLLVLDVTRRLGFRVRLTAIRNNFHLFTLLQDALLAHPTAADWPGPRVRPLLVSVAKGERMLPSISPSEWGAEGESDSAIWTYYAWSAFKPDGSFTTMNDSKPQLPAWIWGEMKPTEIPELDGERVVLLAPLEMPRSWSAGFFVPLHSALRSAVVIECVLSDDEYAASIDRIHRRAFVKILP